VALATLRERIDHFARLRTATIEISGGEPLLGLASTRMRPELRRSDPGGGRTESADASRLHVLDKQFLSSRCGRIVGHIAWTDPRADSARRCHDGARRHDLHSTGRCARYRLNPDT
jgi:hypothetical protein